MGHGRIDAYLETDVQDALAVAHGDQAGDFVLDRSLKRRAARGRFATLPPVAQWPADWRAAADAVLADGEPRTLRTGWPGAADGTLDLSLAPIRDRSGTITGIVGHGIDRSREAGLADTVADHLRLFAKANHDLRQPFQAMRLFLHLLEGRISEPKQAELVQRLGEAIESGAHQLGGLLDYAGLAAGTSRISIGTVSVQTLLDRLVEELAGDAAAAGVTLRRVACTAGLRSDPMMLDRLLRQLIGNAIRHAGPGGRVLIGARRRGDKLALQVLDTGPGIDSNDRERIFEPFIQLEEAGKGRRGLGLGLAIVRAGAAALDHRVELASQPGRGSRFDLLVPLAEVPPPRLGTSPAPQRVAAPLIVVVEDDRLQLAALEATLTDWGYQPVCAGNDAELYRALATLDRPPDLVITDYRLPNGDTGPALVARLRARDGAATMPALLLTGDTHPDVHALARQAGMVLLAKPIAYPRLRLALEQALGRALPG